MLDVAFINLIAAGIERLCRKPGGPASAASPDFDATVIIRELTTAAPTPTGELISRCVENLWQSCRAVGLPAELAEPHLAALPGIIRQAYLRPTELAIFLEPNTTANPDAIPDLSKRIIAAGSDVLAADKLDDVVLTYLLEAFLDSLFASRAIVQEIHPIVANQLAEPATKPEPDSPPQRTSEIQSANAAVTLAKIERADALGITVPLLEVITVTLINLTKSVDLNHNDLLTAAADAAALDEALEHLPDQAPELFEPINHALSAYRAGRIPDCDRMLAPVEDDIVQRSVDVSPHDSELTKLACRVRATRAGLHSLTGSYVKAARHYGFAQRYVPRASTETRWYLAGLEADHYELATYHQASKNGLENAARACTGALATIPDDQTSDTRAEAQAALGRVLILLGERDQDQSRFELAAQLLADAHNVFEEQPERALEEDSDKLLNVVVLRASALTRLGELTNNSDLLEQAAVLLQTLITGKSLPEHTARKIRTHLALALVSFGRLENEQALIDHAIATITSDLPAIEPPPPSYAHSGFSESILAARCHQALATAQLASGDDSAAAKHIAQAASLYAGAGFSDRSQTLMATSAQATSPDRSNPGGLTAELTDNAANAA